MARWLQALLPREDRFFDLFAAHSRAILAGATELRSLLDGGEEVLRHCKSILEHEAAADAITRDVLQSVRRTFITPFDRGDIMQQGMEDRNANIPEGERIRFRVGVNLGDIIIDEGDIFGDGVNVAARLEALAEPGEICVSASVREQVGEKLPIGFADRGEHTVKNITRPVHVYRIDKHAEVHTTAENDPATALLSLADRPS